MAGLDRAEGALRAGDPMAVYGWAGVATSIARRTYLPGEVGSWVELQRASLHNILLRALVCFAAIFLWDGEYHLAERAVEEALALEPYRAGIYGDGPSACGSGTGMTAEVRCALRIIESAQASSLLQRRRSVHWRGVRTSGKPGFAVDLGPAMRPAWR